MKWKNLWTAHKEQDILLVLPQTFEEANFFYQNSPQPKEKSSMTFGMQFFLESITLKCRTSSGDSSPYI